MSESNPSSPRETQVLAVVAVVVSLFAVYAVRSADPDLWGHLRYGKQILDNGGRVGADPFAYTTTDHVWNDHEYLAQMALWLVYAGGGTLGLIVLKCVLGCATVYLLYRLLRLGSDDARLWAPLLILLAACLSRWLVFRPQLFTFLLIAVFVLILFRHLLGRPALLWLLPVLLPLWVNLHGGFLAGLGVIGLALLLRTLQSANRHSWHIGSIFHDALPLTLTLVACVAGSLLNPLGWRLWPYLRTELGYADNRVYIKEWQPIWLVLDTWPGLLPFGILLAVIVILGVRAWLQGRRIADLPAWVWLLSCLPLTLMAFSSNRHVPVALFWMAPVVGLLVGRAKVAEESAIPPAWLAVTGLAGIVALLTIYAALLDPRPRIFLGPSAFGTTRPDRAAAFLKANRLQGKLYTPLWWGSYLTWQLYPEVLVSIDGRNVTLFARDTVTANFRFYTDQRPEARHSVAGRGRLSPRSGRHAGTRCRPRR